MWQLCVKQGHLCQFSNSICSLCVCVTFWWLLHYFKCFHYYNIIMVSLIFVVIVTVLGHHELYCILLLLLLSLQSCLTLCDLIDGSPPGSPVPGILQARTLEWVAISFSNAGKWKVKVKSLSRVWPLATPWTAAYQAPWSMRFSRQEYWIGVPFPSPILYIDELNW